MSPLEVHPVSPSGQLSASSATPSLSESFVTMSPGPASVSLPSPEPASAALEPSELPSPEPASTVLEPSEAPSPEPASIALEPSVLPSEAPSDVPSSAPLSAPPEGTSGCGQAVNRPRQKSKKEIRNGIGSPPEFRFKTQSNYP